MAPPLPPLFRGRVPKQHRKLQWQGIYTGQSLTSDHPTTN
uniref:Uncharacterized protein n=1 Tax=Anguilla anguilla TaxID=7936 RepID=A0A0E9SDG7_ANGAN